MRIIDSIVPTAAYTEVCWNYAINDAHCGRFAVQLDSDDLYSSENTLQIIVDAFHEQKAAMIVGSYRMCDFDLNTLSLYLDFVSDVLKSQLYAADLYNDCWHLPYQCSILHHCFHPNDGTDKVHHRFVRYGNDD